MANERARNLRKTMSDAERKLWQALRARQIEGERFRRQHPIGRYVVDFVCLERRLVVEVDGGQHTEEEHIAHDARRDQWLEAEGYRVLRVPTAEVYGNIAGVVDTIWATLQECALARAKRHPHQERHRAQPADGGWSKVRPRPSKPVAFHPPPSLCQRLRLCRRGRGHSWRTTFASPYVEGAAFGMTRGEGDASAV